MLFYCCGNPVSPVGTLAKSGRRAVKATCPRCGKKQYKLVESKVTERDESIKKEGKEAVQIEVAK